jgi:hypothetical protein
MGAGPDGKQGSLKAHKLTGNREMAEDLERVTCPTCSRLFAPSVLGRHAPICAARAAKDAERAAKVADTYGNKPSSLSDAEWALVLSHRTRPQRKPVAPKPAAAAKRTAPKPSVAKPRVAKKAVVKKTVARPAASNGAVAPASVS